jgi:hypothetical protein
MKAMIAASFLLLPLLIGEPSKENLRRNQNEAQLKLNSVVTNLSNYEITKIEILQIPPLSETYAKVTPEFLDEHFVYRLTIRGGGIGGYDSGLYDVLKSTVVQPESKMPDLRWGIVFYGPKDDRLCSVYFDRWGNGAVGDIPVSFKGDLFKWLNDNFSECFR